MTFYDRRTNTIKKLNLESENCGRLISVLITCALLILFNLTLKENYTATALFLIDPVYNQLRFKGFYCKTFIELT